MADKISMTPAEMDKAATKAHNTANTLTNNVIKEMDRLLSELEKSWQGDAIVGYKARYTDIKKALNNGVELLGEIEKNLKTSKQIVEETDKKIAKGFRGKG